MLNVSISKFKPHSASKVIPFALNLDYL